MKYLYNIDENTVTVLENYFNVHFVLCFRLSMKMKLNEFKEQMSPRKETKRNLNAWGMDV